MADNNINNPLDPNYNNQPQQQNNAGGMQQSMPMQQYQNRQQQQRGTGFTNIGQILQANKGAGQKIGQQIGSGINQQAQAVKQGIQQGQSQFQAGEQQAFNQAQGAINVGNQLAKRTGESDADYATRVANASGDLASQGQALQNAAYTGPQGLANAGELQAKAAMAGALARLGGSISGQNQLLRNLIAGRGNYSTGQAGLDQLLLGQGGQKYVQQASAGAAGLENQAQANITGAANQAISAQNAIEQNRVNALQNLQNSLSGAGDQTSNNITGLITQAQQQGQQFNQNAQRLSQLVSGVDANGNPITQLSDADKALLNNAQNYGLDLSSNLYLKDQNAAQNALQNLARTSLTQGGALYQGNQQQAAQNLATFLGQSDIANQIQNNQFNTNAFATAPSQALSQLNQQQQADIQTQNELRALEGEMLSLNTNKFYDKSMQPYLQGIVSANTNNLSSTAQQQTYQALNNIFSNPNLQFSSPIAGITRQLGNQAVAIAQATQQNGGKSLSLEQLQQVLQQNSTTQLAKNAFEQAANQQVGQSQSIMDYLLNKFRTGATS